jgi:hypothetical protein
VHGVFFIASQPGGWLFYSMRTHGKSSQDTFAVWLRGYRSAREKFGCMWLPGAPNTTHTIACTSTQHQSCCVLWVSLSHYDPPGRTALEKSARPGQRAASLASASSRGVLYRAGPVWAKQAAITARACGRGNLSSRFYWPVVVTLLAK